jgi:hypothetical protein
LLREFVEVKLYHVGVGAGQRERGGDPTGGADGAEQMGIYRNAGAGEVSFRAWRRRDSARLTSPRRDSLRSKTDDWQAIKNVRRRAAWCESGCRRRGDARP